MSDPDYAAIKRLANKISKLTIDSGVSTRDAVYALNITTECFLAELLEEDGVPSDPRLN